MNFQNVTDDAPIIIWMADASGYCIFLNKKWFEFTGQAREEGLGLGWLEAVHPDDRDKIGTTFLAAVEIRSSFSAEYRLRNDAGVYRYVLDMGSPRLGPNAEFLGYIGVVMDIHERKLAEEALFASNERFRAAIQAVEGVMWTIDAQGLVREQQPGWTLLTGQTFEQYQGTGWADVIHPDDRALYLDTVTESLATGKPLNAEHRLKLADGRWRLFSVRGRPVCNADGSVREWVGVHTDITEKREYEKRIAHLANHDALTGLPNRVLLDDRLNHLIHQRGNLQHAILFMDLNRFKIINDSLGHEVGDLMLKETAQRLVCVAREGDTIARFGGDEFVILLENVDSITSVARLADRILELIASPMSLAGHELSTSVSIGASMFPKDGSTTSALLKHADLAMYQAKKLNKNAFRFFDQQMNARTQERLMLENDLRRAIKHHGLSVHYQPQLDVVQHRMVGVEALVRWQHEVRGMVPPAEFIPLAEEIGLIDQIGEQVLLKACQQQKEWQQAGLPQVKVTVNLSVHQLNESFIESVRRILQTTAVDPANVEFEITESALMENISAHESILMQIQALGVRMAIDDFGTGYSSLSYLKKLPIDTLKIDRSFIVDLAENADDAAIVSATIGLAQAMGLNIVAEGVETSEQKKLLIQKGCGVMQGYLFSRPLSPAQFTEFLVAYPRLQAQWCSSDAQRVQAEGRDP